MAKEITSQERRRRLDAFKEILIPHPRLATLKRRVENLIDDTKAIVERNQKKIEKYGKGVQLEHLGILPVIGPSGATKSRSMDEVITHILDTMKLDPHDVPILNVTLRGSIKHTKHLQAQILEAYGDKSAATILTSRNYSEVGVNDDIREAARSRRTYVIVLDETHNVLGGGAITDKDPFGARSATAKNMALAFKSMLNDAVFSIVCMGTDDMRPLFKSKELAGRMKDTVDFGRFEISEQKERDYFFNFVAEFEEQMVEKRVIDGPIGLLDTVERRACVYDLADGVVGQVVRILETSLENALEEGSGVLGFKDIAASIKARNKAIQQMRKNGEDGGETPYYDPFTQGPQRRTLAILREEENDQKKQDAAARKKMDEKADT